MLVTLAFLPFFSPDPAPSATRSKDRSRTLECERVTPEAGREQHPSRVVDTRPRGDFLERSTLICTERPMRPGLRLPRDEAILADLDARATELALAATANHTGLAEPTWVVETFYPDVDVSWKIAFATKNALMSQGVRVSDRVPTLSAGDIGVITRMPAEEAYPTACRRYFDRGSLREGDVLLAVVRLDPRETALHAGLCVRGDWTWLR